MGDVDTVTAIAKSNLVDACQPLVPGFGNYRGGEVEALLLGRLTMRIKRMYANQRLREQRMVRVACIREEVKRGALLHSRVHGVLGQRPDFAVYSQMMVVLKTFHSLAGTSTEFAICFERAAAIAAVAQLGEPGLQSGDG